MLTNNINKVNNAINSAHKFSSILYNKMITEKYGVKPCKECGDEDNIGKYNIHVLDYLKLKLSEMYDSDCSCNQTNKCGCGVKQQCCDTESSGCDIYLVDYEKIRKEILNN